MQLHLQAMVNLLRDEDVLRLVRIFFFPCTMYLNKVMSYLPIIVKYLHVKPASQLVCYWNVGIPVPSFRFFPLSHCFLLWSCKYALLTYGNMPVHPRFRVKLLLKC